MGMFDDITYSCPCPICDQPVTGFQSKDGPCGLNRMTPEKLLMEAVEESINFHEFTTFDGERKRHIWTHFYSSCDVCNTWVEIKIERTQRQSADGTWVEHELNRLR